MANFANSVGFVVGSAFFGLQFAKSFFFVVNAGHRAVMFDRFKGVVAEPKKEGLHFKLPWVQTPYFYEVRTNYENLSSVTGSRDLQTVELSLRVLYRPDIDKLAEIHQTLGPTYAKTVFTSIGNEVLKAVVAQYDASELITQREIVSKQIAESLTKRAKNFNINLDDVAIVHLAFSQEFTKAIEAKQVAQQVAERSKYIVARDEQRRTASIVRAQGEAEAADMLNNALKTGSGFLELRRIEASRDIATNLADSKVVYLPNSTNILLNTKNQA